MTKEEFLDLVRAIAKEFGYRRKGMLFWKGGPELTSLVHLQRSMYSPLYYINIGAAPTAILEKLRPPHMGFGGVASRADSLQGPYQSLLRGVSLDEPEPSIEETSEAFRWLFSWIEDNLVDAESVRRAILTNDNEAPLAMMHGIPQGWIMGDWARGKLQERSTYFRSTPQ